MADTSTLRKTYATAFVLDRGKLSRIMNILEQRMSEIGVSSVPVLALKLQNSKELSLHSVQEVLALDNAVKNPIVQLEIKVSSAKTSAGHVSVHYTIGIAGRTSQSLLPGRIQNGRLRPLPRSRNKCSGVYNQLDLSICCWRAPFRLEPGGAADRNFRRWYGLPWSVQPSFH